MDQQGPALRQEFDAKLESMAAGLQETLTQATNVMQSVVSRSVRQAFPSHQGHRRGPRGPGGSMSNAHPRRDNWRPRRSSGG